MLGLLLGACAAPPELAQRLATGDRPAEDKLRDPGRQPASIVEFMGIEPGMTVLDVIAAGGYYTEVFAEAVGPEGRVYAQNNAFVLSVRDGVNDKALTARLRDRRLPQVIRLDRELDALGLDPGSIDVAFTALNFHDVYHRGGPEAAHALLVHLHELLADDGILGIIDHAGNPAADNAALHRIEEARVVAAATAAGFVVEARSDQLRNPADDRSQHVFTPGLRGATDRFVLRLRKQGARPSGR